MTRYFSSPLLICLLLGAVACVPAAPPEQAPQGARAVASDAPGGAPIAQRGAATEVPADPVAEARIIAAALLGMAEGGPLRDVRAEGDTLVLVDQVDTLRTRVSTGHLRPQVRQLVCGSPVLSTFVARGGKVRMDFHARGGGREGSVLIGSC